jgi:hypothetical protein
MFPIAMKTGPLALCLAAGPVLAAFDAGDVAGPGGFATACVSPSGSGVNIPAIDLLPIMGMPGVGRCESSLYSGLGTAAESATQGAPAAEAAARLGTIALSSRIDTDPVNGRPRSAASGGFADRLLIDSPGSTGLPGHLVVNIGVQGLLQAAGTGGIARLLLQAQANDQDQPPGPGFDAGSGNFTSAPWQLISWFAIHEKPQGFSAVALDEVVSFSIPFVFGQSFEMGIWASVMTDTDNVGDSSRSVADFNPGLNWLGVEGAWVRETRFTTDLSIQSDSGVDWMQPVPEPSTAVLAALGALVLAWRLRALRRPQP